MKTGIVLEIENGKAIVVQYDGSFISLPLQAGWQKGDVVRYNVKKQINLKSLYRVAACFVFMLSLSFYGYNIYFNEISLLSIDVNPSIELGLNRFDRVISVNSHNDEGEEIINTVNLKNKKYNEALELLITGNSISPYFKDNSYVFFTVQSDDKTKEETILDTLNSTTNNAIVPKYQTLKVEYYAVDKTFVEDAHSHGVTAGKYMVLLELKKIVPTIDINEYTHHSISQIKTEIEIHHGGDGAHDHISPETHHK